MSKFNPKFMNEWLEIKREGGYKLLFKKKDYMPIVAKLAAVFFYN